jgi:hypothetical protein
VCGSMRFRPSRTRGGSFGAGYTGTTTGGHTAPWATGAPSNTGRNNQPLWLDFWGARHVGAIKGQFASEIRHCGYAGRVVSFEGLSQAHGQLLQSSAEDSMWEAYPRCALGDHNAEIAINN